MEILNFIIAIVALVVAVMAFQRTGGTAEGRVRQGRHQLQESMEPGHPWDECPLVDRESRNPRLHPSEKPRHRGAGEASQARHETGHTCRRDQTFRS